MVISPQGVIVAESYQELAQHFAGLGWVEHAPEEVWQAIEATREVLGKVDPDPLRAVCRAKGRAL